MTKSLAKPFAPIAGVMTVPLDAFGDERGRFMETFRREWFPQANWERLQSNRSDSSAGVLRGLHYHFKQVDYWCPVAGRLRVGLVDLRRSSPTYLASAAIDMDGDNPLGLFIPEGVAHGFAALSDCTLMYIVNNYYDGGADEYGIAWNDPQANIDWGLANPELSQRDLHNPKSPTSRRPPNRASIVRRAKRSGRVRRIHRDTFGRAKARPYNVILCALCVSVVN